ncbi:hypothetical protein HaLaN_02728 [Haematococcus lacustris]|uniref:Uncharacterized protein n=1 Tax=Haematococcus lacustris TaxID=44745 RepID=A0A699YM08_HAELA|nr:hypothetical protein HaLaN_02728 [Haematococcus lacustris]
MAGPSPSPPASKSTTAALLPAATHCQDAENDIASPTCSFGAHLSRLTWTLTSGQTYWLAVSP